MKKYGLMVFSDQSEDIDYNFKDFPLYVNTGRLSTFEDYRAESHWHEDLEFLYAFDGEMDYFINGAVVKIKKGQAIFVNSGRIHYGYSDMKSDCHFLVIAIHPSLFGKDHPLLKTYWNEAFGVQMENFKILDPSDQAQNKVIESLLAMHEHFLLVDGNPFYLLSKAAQVLYEMGNLLQSISEVDNYDLTWDQFSAMLTYIYDHYDQKVTISEISESVGVCRSNVYLIFERYAGKTPIDVLNAYRLERSMVLLRDTKRSVTEIAMSCGFRSNSYFTYYFRQHVGMTPKGYRNNR